jgi:hypothetical protein
VRVRSCANARRPVLAASLTCPGLATVGALDVLGSSVYAVATTFGRVSLVAVAAFLYPAVSVILAAWWTSASEQASAPPSR